MNYTPFNLGTRFRIAPPEDSIDEEQRLTLLMQRGAFGSGEHETTESCLNIMAEMPEVQGARVLDLGSGTGILAIAALKLGADHALCVDIEAGAVATAERNCQLNGLEGKVFHQVGTLENVAECGFDLILANIYGDILLSIAKPLTAKLRIGGRLLLSGILWEYNFDVRQAYERQGCEVVRNRMLKEFSTIEMIRSA